MQPTNEPVVFLLTLDEIEAVARHIEDTWGYGGVAQFLRNPANRTRGEGGKWAIRAQVDVAAHINQACEELRIGAGFAG